MRTYDEVLVKAPLQLEGTLIYVLDKSELYIRARDGIRQVNVYHFSLLYIIIKTFFIFNFCVYLQLGSYVPFYREAVSTIKCKRHTNGTL